jgi:hypothetical protein
MFGRVVKRDLLTKPTSRSWVESGKWAMLRASLAAFEMLKGFREGLEPLLG